MSAPLYLKDPAAAKFVAGGLSEVEDLFGAPLPDLPALERDEGRDVWLVHVHSRLRRMQQRFLETQLAQIGALTLTPGGDPGRDYSEYESVLTDVVRALRQADRRQGLLNLFWLAHSRQAAEHLRALEQRSTSLRRGKQSIFPLVQSFYHRVDQDCRWPRGGDVPAAAGNGSLVASVIDDGFAFTEATAAEVDLTHFLAANKRYRLPADAFYEIQQVLVREAERRLREGDRGLLGRAGRHLPLLPREHYLKPGSLLRIVMSPPVLAYLLGDPWTTAPKLLACPSLRFDGDRRRGPEVLDAFLDLTVALRRFEVVSHLRDRIVSLGTDRPDQLDDKARRGLRVYEFGESSEVLNNAVAATVLFMDLRGFTRTSEGHISERDLTRELYLVFDEFVPIVERFGGKVDKYLGDGLMVTWGTDRADALDPLNALRSAILCQESLARQRGEGRTWFKMGVAIHHGRVYLARFMAGDGDVQATVIGRNVNLAGRLSSAAKRPAEEDDGAGPMIPPNGGHVRVDTEGRLFNEGIALSRDTLGQLESELALVHGEGGLEYDDAVINRRIFVRYAGDAKFKGVRSSLPVYEALYEARG